MNYIVKISGDKSSPLIKAIMDLSVEQRNILKSVIQISIVDGAEISVCNAENETPAIDESLDKLIKAIKELNDFCDNLNIAIE